MATYSKIPLPSIYFRALYLRDIKCFRGDFVLSFTDRKSKPTLWSVLLGNNNTGKTTTLKMLAAMAYPRVMEEYLTKYNPANRAKIYRSNTTRNTKKNKSTTLAFYDWLSNDNYRPQIGPNLFFPYFDFSLQIKRDLEINKIVDLSSISTAEISYLNNYYYNISKTYNDSLIIYAYGIHRKVSDSSLSEYSDASPVSSLFQNTDLFNIEEWILQTDYATRIGPDSNREKATILFDRLKHILLFSKAFPDIIDIRINSSQELKSFVEVKVGDNWVKIKDLGYGYQSTIAWVIDLAKRMFDRYPDLENPLHGPAIVLVDEIDLHLHPEWQRKIIKYLSDLFPNTQFIVTAHSPLIVQSAESVNLIMLEKDDETGSINVRQQFGSFQGWTVEEILRELMDMGEKTRSERYLDLMRQFEDALLHDDYKTAKSAFDELDKILSPSSHQRKVLQIQMSSLIPA